jgi:hypothetical protein
MPIIAINNQNLCVTLITCGFFIDKIANLENVDSEIRDIADILSLAIGVLATHMTRAAALDSTAFMADLNAAIHKYPAHEFTYPVVRRVCFDLINPQELVQ